eukprot:TRINITY_DN3425_c0_g1_i1.p1 TRINITY_DN3425_c0_g1~~TRINITY_DN3425_c0_g1_i1.p1  ORF type:complete len:306 (+),score=41.59 TRINITY_DN3425_c0_g1_i1:54-971(+)
MEQNWQEASSLEIRHLVMPDRLPNEKWNCVCIAASSGRLYVINRHIIEIIDATSGVCLAQWGHPDQPGLAVIGQPPQFGYPYGIAIDEHEGRAYVVDNLNHCLVVVRLADGLVEAVWGSQGRERHEFNYPTTCFLLPDRGVLYVADGMNRRVKVLRLPDGECIQVIGQFENPPSFMAVHQDGGLFLTSSYEDRILVYSLENGRLLLQLGEGEGSGPTQFQHPSGMCIDHQAGLLYVADRNNQRISVSSAVDGSYVGNFGVIRLDHEPFCPVDVAWDAVRRVLYVVSDSAPEFCVFSNFAHQVLPA